MRIALVAHARFPIAPPFAGGLEAHNWHLVAALEARGHDVTLFASGDSDPRFRIDAIVPRHVEADFPDREHRDDAALRDHVDRAYAGACARIAEGGFDVVHNHSLHRFVLALCGGRAAVSSVHTPPLGGLPGFAAAAASPVHRLTCVSRSQRDLWWPDGAPTGTAIVPNGIDPARWPFAAGTGAGAIWCGRIARDKAPHLAIAAAARAGVPIAIAGPIEDRGYFDAAVRPLLGPAACHLGHLDAVSLAAAMAAAALFVATPCWEEPFGLAAIEAMACGLPVAAFDRGAVREVVGEDAGRFAPPGDVAALADAIRAAAAIDRAIPRRRAERFAIDRMVDGYEALYREVTLGRTPPR